MECVGTYVEVFKLLTWAQKYARLGLSVIPLRPKGKEPLIPWTEFQSRRATESELTEWWKKWPNANVGIVTGKISSAVIVDLDGPEGIAQASLLKLSSSVISLTGNGKHLWYMLNSAQDIVSNAVRIKPGIDIRGDGGYVCVPPSVHESGRRYRWLTPFVNAAKLPEFPKTLLIAPTVSFEPNFEYEAEFGEERKESGWVAKALEGMKNGNIDDTLFTICSRLRADGYSAVDAAVLLQPHADRVGATPGHLQEKIENVWARYEPNKPRPRMAQIPERSLLGEGLVIHSPSNPDSIKEFEQTYANCGEVIQTGFKSLDSLFSGGLKSERLFTVAALTGHAKTNFGIGLSRNLCEKGFKVLYFSTEFSYKKIWQRYIATLSHPDKFREHAFYVFDGFTPNIGQVEEAINKIKPNVFIFDHIQQISKDRDALTEFMKGCQFLQRKYALQGIILAQLNRTADVVEDGQRVAPRISMIEGSATIEQASSRVLLLSRNKMLPEYHEITGYLEKNDDGDTGIVNFALYRNPYHLEEI